MHTGWALVARPGGRGAARQAGDGEERALAERLGLKEQQIQRYEATRCAGASLERLQAIADGLGVTIKERVILPAPTPKTDPE